MFGSEKRNSMRVRYIWRKCTYRGKSWDASPVDAFWVETTEQEARRSVFSALTPHQVEESRQLARQLGNVAAAMGKPVRSFCYLVARDLSSVDPFPSHYPEHQLWNGYSPFEPMPETAVADLTDLRSINTPDDVGTLVQGESKHAGSMNPYER